MAQVGGNGNRKQTLRTNVVQPYSVGFLREKEHADYNVAVYDELEKVSTSTKHLFKGLDDVNKEIQNRTKALDALGLQVSEDFKRVWFEFNGVKQQIGTGIKLENITDLNGVPLTGYLTGIQTQVTGANGRISQAFGEIDNNYQYFLGEITTINGHIGTITTQVGEINDTGGKHFQEVWGVKEKVGDLEASFGLVIEGGGNPNAPDAWKHSNFYVHAQSFNIYTDPNSDVPVFSVTGNQIKLGSGVKIDQANIDQFIKSDNYRWDSTAKQGWLLNARNGNANFGGSVEIVGTVQSGNYDSSGGTAGWRIDNNGNATFNNGNFRGTIHATGGTIDGNVVINGSISAEHIKGDLYNAQTNAFHIVNGKQLSKGDHMILTIAGDDYDRILDTNMIMLCASSERQYFTLREGGDGLADVDVQPTYDTGNDGDDAGWWTLQGITLRRVGKGNHNYIKINVRENRNASISINTPYPLSFRPGVHEDKPNSLYYMLAPGEQVKTVPSSREKPTVRVYRKSSNIVTASMTQ